MDTHGTSGVALGLVVIILACIAIFVGSFIGGERFKSWMHKPADGSLQCLSASRFSS
jgi:hypothetical protein